MKLYGKMVKLPSIQNQLRETYDIVNQLCPLLDEGNGTLFLYDASLTGWEYCTFKDCYFNIPLPDVQYSCTGNKEVNGCQQFKVEP